MKATSAWSGPFDDVIIPRGSTKLDYEVELALVIGRTASYVDEREALDYVAGYATFCDFSERAFQKEMGGQWTKGKSADSFAPMGPWLVTADEIADPQKLRLWCKVNGELRQNSWTGDMMFSVRQLVSYISRFMTLLPGDVVATGTPERRGHGHVPAALPAGRAISSNAVSRGWANWHSGWSHPAKHENGVFQNLAAPCCRGRSRRVARGFRPAISATRCMRRLAVPEGTAARCARCGALLYQNRPASLVRASAFSLAALLLMVAGACVSVSHDGCGDAAAAPHAGRGGPRADGRGVSVAGLRRSSLFTDGRAAGAGRRHDLCLRAADVRADRAGRLAGGQVDVPLRALEHGRGFPVRRAGQPAQAGESGGRAFRHRVSGRLPG